MTHNDQLILAAKGEDTQDLLNHIAWTDVIKPRLRETVSQYTTILVNEALGGPLPPGKTREQVAGICYGINHTIKLLEKILQDGERAVKDLQDEGLSLTALAR